MAEVSAETEAERKEKERKRVLGTIENQLPAFRWNIDNIINSRDQLIERLKNGEEKIVGLVLAQPGLEPQKDENGKVIERTNVLGKRRECLVCGTVILCTKAGEGKTTCCDQEMITQEARPIPSSD